MRHFIASCLMFFSAFTFGQAATLDFDDLTDTETFTATDGSLAVTFTMLVSGNTEMPMAGGPFCCDMSEFGGPNFLFYGYNFAGRFSIEVNRPILFVGYSGATVSDAIFSITGPSVQSLDNPGGPGNFQSFLFAGGPLLLRPGNSYVFDTLPFVNGRGGAVASIDYSSVPLPAGGLLLLSAMGAILVRRRLKARA